MKLELKHLAPYLPYKLQMYCETMNGCETFKWALQPNNIDDVLGFQNKPILRPLSDLVKKNEVDGEIFIPIHSLSMYANEQTNKGKNGLEWGIFRTLPYSDFIKLFKWHFDVFGLIENGLAIDINTLQEKV